MGKWATYQKRGSCRVGDLLPSPNPPLLTLFEGNLIATSDQFDNAGGGSLLYFSGSVNGPWTLYATRPWDVDTNWEDPEDLPPTYLKATTGGNGVAYRGESGGSNVFDNR
jgi:hypothetical protein